MRELTNIVRQLFSGKRTIDNTIKFQAIAVIIGLVHLLFTVTFFRLHVSVLFYYNIFAVLFYALITYLLSRLERQNILFISAFAEIILHSAVATVMLGKDYGFMLYTISLLPLSFYVCYTIPHFKKNAVVPSFCSLIVFIAWFASNYFSDTHNPLLDIQIPESSVLFLYYFNMIMTFAYTWTISTLFTIEVAYMQHNLETENNSLEELANYDPLTKLVNRRSMNNHLKSALEAAIENEEEFSIIMTDIDDFKLVNDTYGHAAGDEILVKISNILMADVREEDIVCRWGGEEMLILIRAGKDVAFQAAERIRSDVADITTIIDGHQIKVTMTLGVSGYKKGDNIRSMVQKADICLYEGKNSGKNQVVMN